MHFNSLLITLVRIGRHLTQISLPDFTKFKSFHLLMALVKAKKLSLKQWPLLRKFMTLGQFVNLLILCYFFTSHTEGFWWCLSSTPMNASLQIVLRGNSLHLQKGCHWWQIMPSEIFLLSTEPHSKITILPHL